MQENTKSLKKQLAAAIAMLLVAVVALGAASYAWFVSNNKVDATTTTISAQSNSAYLVIQEKTETQTATDKTSEIFATAADPDTVDLYPAQVVNGTADGYKFESAYATATDNADEKENTRFAIGTSGTATEAVNAKYAHQDTFYIGTGGYDGNFSNLKVSDVAVTVNNAESKADLKNAVRVLVVCGDQWCVWKDGSEVTSVKTFADANLALTPKYTDGTNKAIAAAVGKDNDVTVDIYVFYDGAESEVKSTNLANLKGCNVKVTFEATPKEFGKTA